MSMIKKIDMHVHTVMAAGILRPGVLNTYATPEELLAIYRDLNVDKAVLLPEVNPECSQRIQSNEEAVRIVEKFPDTFYWFCNIDPRMWSNGTDADLSHFIGFYKELGAKGVGEICANLYFDDPRVDNLFRHCELTCMPVIFHIAPQVGGCYGLADELGLPRMEKELSLHPSLRFIGHSQPFWAEISGDASEENRNAYPKGPVTPGGRIPELMRKYPNLCADLSAGSGCNAICRDASFGCSFLEEFQDRLYFGTDICAPGEPPGLSRWLDDAVANGLISTQCYDKICRKNAEKLLIG